MTQDGKVPGGRQGTATPRSVTGSTVRLEMASNLRYAIITAARDEAQSLPRLAAALRAQSLQPSRWIIVENGSTDDTFEVASSLAMATPWTSVVRLPEAGRRERGGPIVRAFQAGLAALDEPPEVLVNVDADVTMGDTYFESLIRAFDTNANLGIASGSAWESDGLEWRQRFVTGGTVWGATRAYRWECLSDVLPLEERHGWDGIDQLKARARGWQTRYVDRLGVLSPPQRRRAGRVMVTLGGQR